MKRCISLIALLLLAHTASAADGIPSLAKVFEGQFCFGFGGTHDYFVRTELNKPDSSIRQIVETQSNIIGINCFYPNSIHPTADIWR